MRRPLKRRPKQLDDEPSVFQVALRGGAGGTVLTGASAGGKGQAPRGSDAPGTTGESGAESGTPSDARGEPRDAEAYLSARQIASRLSIRPPRRRACGAHPGTGPLTSRAYCDGADEIDVDRTIDVMTERPVLEESDIIVRDRARFPPLCRPRGRHLWLDAR
jgi:hypothetical protein